MLYVEPKNPCTLFRARYPEPRLATRTVPLGHDVMPVTHAPLIWNPLLAVQTVMLQQLPHGEAVHVHMFIKHVEGVEVVLEKQTFTVIECMYER